MKAARIVAPVKNLSARKTLRRWRPIHVKDLPMTRRNIAAPMIVGNLINAPLRILPVRRKVVENVAVTRASVAAANKVVVASAGIAVSDAGPRPAAAAAPVASNPWPGSDLKCFPRPGIV